jgi:non-canonical purine NTP pyrophosphatase (RdgB/HAM1 family)
LTSTSGSGGGLLFVSGNAGKAHEFETILGVHLERLALDLPEIQALDPAEVVRHKAAAAFAAAGRPVLVEDTGLAIDALGGLPGALVRWFLQAVGPAGICAMLPLGAERGATARTAVAVADGNGVEVFVGETRGTIADAPAGEGGFGWDSIFVPGGATRTFAELAPDDKDRSSMRRDALERLRSGTKGWA